MFCMRVPVLSEQMMVADPRVSTSGRGTDNVVLGGHDIHDIRVGESHNNLNAFRKNGNGTGKGSVDWFNNFATVPLRVKEGHEEGGHTHGNNSVTKSICFSTSVLMASVESTIWLIGGLLGVTLLVDSNPGVEYDDGDEEGDLDSGGEFMLTVGDRDGLDEGHNGDGDEYVDEHVVDVVPDTLQQRLLDLLHHFVGSKLDETVRSLVGAQANFGVIVFQAHLLDGFFYCHGVPWRIL